MSKLKLSINSAMTHLAYRHLLDSEILQEVQRTLNTQLLNTLVSRIQVRENIKVIRENLGDIRKCVSSKALEPSFLSEKFDNLEHLVNEQKKRRKGHFGGIVEFRRLRGERRKEKEREENKKRDEENKRLDEEIEQWQEEYDRRYKEGEINEELALKLLAAYKHRTDRVLKEAKKINEDIRDLECLRISQQQEYEKQYWEMREEELKQFEEEFKKQFADLNEEQLVELTEGLEKYFAEKDK